MNISEIECTNSPHEILENFYEYSTMKKIKDEQILSAFCQIILKNTVDIAKELSDNLSKIKNDTIKPHLIKLLDKLSSIPDFYFPRPGEESISILAKRACLHDRNQRRLCSF